MGEGIIEALDWGTLYSKIWIIFVKTQQRLHLIQICVEYKVQVVDFKGTLLTSLRAETTRAEKRP